MRGNATKFPDKRLSVAAAKAQMLQFLYGCRDDMLSRVTVDDLVTRYRTDRKTAEYELTIARQKRGAGA